MAPESPEQIWQAFLLMQPRLFGCFLWPGILGPKMAGGLLVRGGVVLGLGLFLVPVALAAPVLPAHPGAAGVALIIAKELFLGFLVGFGVNLPLMVMSAVGSMIDNQRGATIMESLNPLTENQDSPLGDLFSQGIIAVFFSTGIFLVFLDGLYMSYLTWPVYSYVPRFDGHLVELALNWFSLFARMVLLLCSAVFIAIFLPDMGLALLNRIAPRMNVFILSLSVRSMVALAVLCLYASLLYTHGAALWKDVGGLVEQVFGRGP